MTTINVALIGQGFMGRSHSNAWGQVAKFFTLPISPIMHTVFGQAEENPQSFAANWGWKNASTNWEQLVKSPPASRSAAKNQLPARSTTHAIWSRRPRPPK